MTTPKRYSSGFDDLIGLRMLEATGDRVVAELPVTEALLQPTGIVHGGVHATLVETTASVGASQWLGEGRAAVGISNHTDFLRAVSAGVLRAEAVPVQRGRTMQLWRVDITDEQQRAVASGRVRLFNTGQDGA